MRTVAAGVVLLLAAVSGCSAEEAAPAEVGPLASATARDQVAPASSIASERPAVPKAEKVPTAAQEDSPQGASAFVQHYFGAVVNEAYATGDPSAVAALSDASCGSCANIVADVERLEGAGLRVGGSRFRVRFAEASPPESDGSVIVDFRFSSDEYVEVDASGVKVRTEPAQVNQDAQAKLLWRGSGWIVTAIRTV